MEGFQAEYFTADNEYSEIRQGLARDMIGPGPYWAGTAQAQHS